MRFHFFLLLIIFNLTYIAFSKDKIEESSVKDEVPNKDQLVNDLFSQISREALESSTNGEPGGNKNNLNQLKRGGTGGGGRVSGGSRGSGSRVSGGASRGSSGGVRTGSTTTYRNTRTGATIQRPPGSQWTRSALIFLPIARSYSRRSQSSSNRFTTPSSGAESYYYCTSNTDPNVEIQCSSVDNDNECCEQPGTGQPFCCGGDIPDDYVSDPNRALKMFTRILYTLAALALCFYFYRRRSYG